MNAGGQLGPDKVVEDEAPSTTDKPNRPRKADHDVVRPQNRKNKNQIINLYRFHVEFQELEQFQ